MLVVMDNVADPRDLDYGGGVSGFLSTHLDAVTFYVMFAKSATYSQLSYQFYFWILESNSRTGGMLKYAKIAVKIVEVTARNCGMTLHCGKKMMIFSSPLLCSNIHISKKA